MASPAELEALKTQKLAELDNKFGGKVPKNPEEAAAAEAQQRRVQLPFQLRLVADARWGAARLRSREPRCWPA